MQSPHAASLRLPRTRSALFKASSNRLQGSQLFSEIGLLEADLTSTRRDLYAANVRSKSLTSVLKEKASKLQSLEEQLSGHGDHLKVCYVYLLVIQQNLRLCESRYLAPIRTVVGLTDFDKYDPIDDWALYAQQSALMLSAQHSWIAAFIWCCMRHIQSLQSSSSRRNVAPQT